MSISFLRLGKSLRSMKHWMTPWRVPNWESRPRVKSIMKKRMAQKLPPGNWFTASVNRMNARPVPLADWKSYTVCKLNDRQIIENFVP